MATAILVVLGLLWVPFMQYISSQLYIYLQSVQAYIAPPIAACFLLGLFIKKLNGAGAINSLLNGFVLGALRLILELIHGRDHTILPEGSIWVWIAEIKFLHYAIFLFVVSSTILVVVSLLTKSYSEEKIKGLIYGTAISGDTEVEEKAPDLSGAKSRTRFNIILSVIFGLFLGILWIIFA